MAVTRILNPTCKECGKPLKDRISKMFMIGPDCRRTMSDAQLRASLQVAKQEADPGYVPPDLAPSARARHTNARARAAIAQAAHPETATCHHGGMPRACPECRREADPTRAAERILAEIRAQPLADRRTERITAQDGRYPARTPARPPTQSPAPTPPPGSAQMELA